MSTANRRQTDASPGAGPAPRLDEARADGIARSLHRAAVAWACTFLKSRAGLDRALAEQLTAETLAFGLTLLDERLRGCGPGAAAFAARVRHAAWVGHSNWRRDRRPVRQLSAGETPAGGEAVDVSAFTVACRGGGGENGSAFEFTAAMHAEFCALTGLGTSELAANGTNLAALVFYLVVHGRVFARRPHSREERRWLVQALRESREQLDRALADWLAAPTTAVARPVSAGIGR